jgi:biopolymer transport protein ExbB/TolQ
MSYSKLEKFISEELRGRLPSVCYWIVGAGALLVTLLALFGIGLRIPLEWETYLFNILQNTGPMFSRLLALVFTVGMALVLERLTFYVCYFCCSTRIRQCAENKYDQVTLAEAGALGGQAHSHRNYTIQFLRSYLEFGANEGVVEQEDVRDQARHRALDLACDGVDLKFGLKTIHICALLGPTLGFMGTLCGLVDSFGELAYGAGLSSVLGGLSLSMTTSLLGAGIYVVFLSTGYAVELLANVVDTRTDRALRHFFDSLN